MTYTAKQQAGKQTDAGSIRLRHDLSQYVAAGLLLTELPLGGSSAADQLADQMRIVREILLSMRELLSSEPDATAAAAPIDLVDLIHQCRRVTQTTHGCSVVVEGDQTVVTFGDQAWLRRALLNVLDNAGRAAGDAGTVTVAVRSGAGESVVEVTDDGQGFGTIKPHSGQGLSIVDAALRRSGGRLEISSGPAGGTTVRLRLPTAQQERTA